MHLYIAGRKLNYYPRELTYDNAKRLDFAVAEENLKRFNCVARRDHLFFLLYFGTLLGVIREGSFIKHDIDIDVVIHDEEKLLDIIPELEGEGLLFVRFEKTKSLHSFTTLYSFMRDEVYIDVYVAYKEGNKYNLLGKYISRSFVESSVECRFLGETFLIPRGSRKLLVVLYGDDWRTPVENMPGMWTASKDRSSFAILKRMIVLLGHLRRMTLRAAIEKARIQLGKMLFFYRRYSPRPALVSEKPMSLISR